MYNKNIFCLNSSKSILFKPCRIFLFFLQIAIICMAIGSTAWNVVTEIKTLLIDKTATEFNVWTTIFTHPIETSLINYLISSFLIFLCFAYFYSRFKLHQYSTISFICRRAAYRNTYVMLLALLLFIPFAIKSGCPLHLRTVASACMVLLAFVPANSLSICHSKKNNPERLGQILRIIAVTITVLLLGVMVLEVFYLIKGPVHILNEFLPLPGMPHIDGKYINISDLPVRIEPPLRHKLLVNSREYFYQLANRGGFNHIGHVLNPLNEYLNGKNISNIYFQYSLGFSFVHKWTMDLFGGLSVQSYYKCYIYYILYWVLYISISIYLFRSVFYVFFSALSLATSFFMVGYDAFLLAPGINPLIHFFDLPLLFFLFRYFNGKNAYNLIFAFCLALSGILINQQFGLLSMLAAVLTLAMFYIENENGLKRLLLIAILPCAIIAPLVFLRTFLPVATDTVFEYFLKGYFTWLPDSRFVALAVANAAISYAFLLWKRNDATPFKYVFVFLFFYFQALLVYYFWNGMSNHFWPIFPIMGLQLLVMVRILLQGKLFRSQAVRVICTCFVLIISVFTLINASKVFYRQKRCYNEVFTTLKVYSWDFERSRILTTIDPAPINDSITLLQRFSGSGANGKGVVLISVFDTIIPLLADRYSLLPFFEMQWFLFTKKEVDKTIQQITLLKPKYIFVGHEVETEQFREPYLAILESVSKPELESALGRLKELKNVFKAVSLDYAPIEKGKLITVYKRLD